MCLFFNVKLKKEQDKHLYIQYHKNYVKMCVCVQRKIDQNVASISSEEWKVLFLWAAGSLYFPLDFSVQGQTAGSMKQNNVQK